MEQPVISGRLRRSVTTAVVALGLLLWPAATPDPIQAAAPAVQDVPAPPSRAEVWFRDALTGPEVFEPGNCPTGANGGEIVGEGYKQTVRGRCIANRNVADVAKLGFTPMLGDGEVALDFRVVEGVGRAAVYLHTRLQGGNSVTGFISVGTGQAELHQRVNGSSSLVALRQDVAKFITSDDWNHLALRLRGGEVWLLLNDEPILHATGVPTDLGGVGLQTLREGDLDSEGEVTVVYHGLTFSKLGGPAEDEAAPDSDTPESSPNSTVRP
jgi:hypothetical protein